MTALQLRPRAILVLGMHRSGTSAITRVLNLLGVELGSRLMPAAAGNNEGGFWEHLGVVEIHDALLHALGRSWHDLRPLPDGWLRSDPARAAKIKLTTLIESDFADSPLWAVKDPRLCRLLPLWSEILAELRVEPCVVMVLRHPDEVARSLRDRDRFPPAQGRLSWLEHVADAERDSRGWQRSIVAYEDVLFGWRLALEQLGVELAIDWPRDLDRVSEEVDAYLDRGLRHHTLNTTRAEELPGLIRDVYDAMHAIARGEGPWGELSAAVDRYCSMADIFANGFEAEMASDHARVAALEVAMKSDACERSEALLITLREIDSRVGASGDVIDTRSRGDSATLYWCAEKAGAFDEAHKVMLESARAIGGERLVFRLPELRQVSRLRIDPSTRPGRFDLLGLRIGQMPVEDFAERVGCVNQMRLLSQGPGHIALVSMNDDPHFEMNVDDLDVDWSGGAVVELHVLRQNLPKAGFDEVWQSAYGDLVAACTQSITDLEQRLKALGVAMTEQLRAEERAAGLDMLNRLEELLHGADAQHVERHDMLGRDVGRLLERVDDHTAELAELRKAFKVMDDERRRTLLQRVQATFRRH